jgi:hypothetical protein
MTVMDKINQKYSRGTIKIAAEGEEKAWQMRRSYKSPNYTGDWKEVLKVRCQKSLILSTLYIYRSSRSNCFDHRLFLNFVTHFTTVIYPALGQEVGKVLIISTNL